MLKSHPKRYLPAIAILLTAFSALPALAKSQLEDNRPQVDLAIALDVSGSMSGLIDSARQRLWDIVNELGRAEPQPILRVAILSYGNPSYGSEAGYVRIDQPFTRDLDAVNQKLFAFTTSGGDEYVARVVDRSARALHWSPKPNALRIIFVAGNESAEQDPQIPLAQAARAAQDRRIVINTLYCGAEGDGIASGWRKAADLGLGMFASIDQHAAAVANIETPMDAELSRLNDQLNTTYVAFGQEGESYRRNQLEQDANAELMSSSAKASRAVTKAGGMYSSAHWDLVDAVNSGQKLEEIEVEELPEEMQDMEIEARADYLQAKQQERRRIQSQIAKLDEDRRVFIESKRKEQSASGMGLDDAIRDGLRKLAIENGFTFAE